MRSKTFRNRRNQKGVHGAVDVHTTKKQSLPPKKEASTSYVQPFNSITVNSRLPLTNEFFPSSRVSIPREDFNWDYKYSPQNLDNFPVQRQKIHNNPSQPIPIPFQAPSSKNTKKAKPTTSQKVIPLDTDEGFLSGAWLFDIQAAPQWFIKASGITTSKIQNQPVHPIHTTEVKNTNPFPSSQIKKKITRNEEIGFESGAWLFNIHEAPVWFRDLIPKYSTAVSRTKGKPLKSTIQNIQKKAVPIPDPYDFIQSGEWLFNIQSAPGWFQDLVPKYSKNISRTNGKQLKSKVQNIQKRSAPIPGPYDFMESGEWLFNIQSAPGWFRKLVSHKYIPKRINDFSFNSPTKKILDQVVFTKTFSDQPPPALIDEDLGFDSNTCLFDTDSISVEFRNEYSNKSLKKLYNSLQSSRKNLKGQKKDVNRYLTNNDESNKFNNEDEFSDDEWTFNSKWAQSKARAQTEKITRLINGSLLKPAVHPKYFNANSLPMNPTITYKFPETLSNRFQLTDFDSKIEVSSKPQAQAHTSKKRTKPKSTPKIRKIHGSSHSPDLAFSSAKKLFDPERVPKRMKKEFSKLQLRPQQQQPQSTISLIYKTLKNISWFIAFY
ncbi:hypothetical protein HMI56_005335 [Coelomomyces lativittatus]|nr:hypothetical protein HMI56_005335 [Coelomomyces lativittatus]